MDLQVHSFFVCVSNANYEFQIDDESKLLFGGYIKVDARYVDGDVAYRDYWIRGGAPLAKKATQFRIFANEYRFNMKYDHGDLTGFIEMDFYTASTSGNQIAANSTSPRLRHAYASTKVF